MEIYLSVGVSTLVALMAAHRTDAGGDRTIRAVTEQEDISDITFELDAGPSSAVERDRSLR
jgi:hypothetical protein